MPTRPPKNLASPSNSLSVYEAAAKSVSAKAALLCLQISLSSCGQREDHVMVWAGQQSLPPTGKPLHFGQPPALRATAMSTGVVGNLMIVTIRTTVDMPPEFPCATVDDRPSRTMHVAGQATSSRKASEMLLKNRLKCDGHRALMFQWKSKS